MGDRGSSPAPEGSACSPRSPGPHCTQEEDRHFVQRGPEAPPWEQWTRYLPRASVSAGSSPVTWKAHGLRELGGAWGTWMLGPLGHEHPVILPGACPNQCLEKQLAPISAACAHINFQSLSKERLATAASLTEANSGPNWIGWNSI